MHNRSKRPRVAFVVMHTPEPAGPGYEPQYVQRCTAPPTRDQVKEWTTDPAKARLFSYNVGRTVANRAGARLVRVQVDQWNRQHRAQS